MVPGEIKNNAYSKFVWTNKEYYGIFQNRMETFQQAKKKHDSKLIRLRIWHSGKIGIFANIFDLFPRLQQEELENWE